MEAARSPRALLKEIAALSRRWENLLRLFSAACRSGGTHSMQSLYAGVAIPTVVLEGEAVWLWQNRLHPAHTLWLLDQISQTEPLVLVPEKPSVEWRAILDWWTSGAESYPMTEEEKERLRVIDDKLRVIW
jgi:hypothetical protein